MTHNVISYAFVGVWSQPITEIPILEKKFCLDLFEDPYNTSSGMGPDGFIIKYDGKINPTPSVLIGPQRIVVITENVEKTASILNSVCDELNKISGGRLPLKLKAIGINTEHEWINLGMNSKSWLTNKFVIKGLNVEKKHENFKILTSDVNFQIIKDENEKLGISIQPRTNMSDGLFMSVNHHHENGLMDFPDKLMMSKLFADSIDYINNDIYNLIIK